MRLRRLLPGNAGLAAQIVAAENLVANLANAEEQTSRSTELDMPGGLLSQIRTAVPVRSPRTHGYVGVLDEQPCRSVLGIGEKYRPITDRRAVLLAALRSVEIDDNFINDAACESQSGGCCAHLR